MWLLHTQGEIRGRSNYAAIQQIWHREGMQTLRDWLVFYNNADVVPFLEALESHVQVMRGFRLDMLADACTLPGLALKYAMRDLGGVFHTLGSDQADVHRLIRKNLIGGPTIVFHRYINSLKRICIIAYIYISLCSRALPGSHTHHVPFSPRRLAISGETAVRGDPTEVCRRVTGFDANGLYAYSMSLMMPTGPCWIRTAPGFERKGPNPRGVNHSQASIEWLDFEVQQRGVKIFHAGNGPEVRIGAAGVPVDGFAPSTCTAYFFDGCYWHHCESCHGDMSPAKRARLESRFHTTPEDIRRYDDMTKEYVSGYSKEVVTMKECEWNAAKKVAGSAQQRYMEARKPGRDPATAEGHRTELEILQAICDGSFFGAALVDLTTPDALKDHFSELPPIFKYAEIGLEDVSRFMRNKIINSVGHMKSRRSLISSYHGREVLLITPLLRWYIEHGLVVTKVHMTLEWEPRRCFEHLAQNMANSRRQADVDPNWKLMGDACKLIANAVYGKCIQNKQKMTQTHMCRGKKAQLLINSSRYRGHKRLQPNAEDTCQASGRRQEDKQVPVLQLIQDSNVPSGTPDYEAQEEALALDADAIYELSTTPRSISEDLPVQIALYVYQYAKFHILSFKYDFLDVYFDKRKWQLLYSDTDSFYLQLSVE